MWNERFQEKFNAYGTEPNDFLRAVARAMPKGEVLVIGAGEGRNAVYLAELGYDVSAVDQSAVGLENAQQLAASRGVALRTTVADLTTFDFGSARWSGIVSIWTHLPAPVRTTTFASCVEALRPGGALILEWYAPQHLERAGQGGPPILERLFSPADAHAELKGLDFELLQQAERDISEGAFHKGPSATTQVLARKPLPSGG